MIKLSEAIRLGIGFVKDNRLFWLNDECGCALGAAAYAMGVRANHDVVTAIKYYWPWTEREVVTPDGMNNSSVLSAISWMHYTKKMTREQIADWVETIEPADAAPVQTDHEATARA